MLLKLYLQFCIAFLLHYKQLAFKLKFISKITKFFFENSVSSKRNKLLQDNLIIDERSRANGKTKKFSDAFDWYVRGIAS